MVKFFRLDERLEDLVFIRNHLSFETSNTPVPANSYLSITQGKTSAEALERMIVEMKDRIPSEVMELFLEEFDFEHSDPLSVGFDVTGNVYEMDSLVIKPVLVESDEPPRHRLMVDGEIAGTLRKADDWDGYDLPEEFMEELGFRLERLSSLRVEARLDIAGVLAAVVDRKRG